MSNELFDIREKIWQLLHNHRREDEWSAVVMDILSVETDTCRIAVVKKMPDFPEPKYKSGGDVLIRHLQQLRDAGFAQEVKE